MTTFLSQSQSTINTLLGWTIGRTNVRTGVHRSFLVARVFSKSQSTRQFSSSNENESFKVPPISRHIISVADKALVDRVRRATREILTDEKIRVMDETSQMDKQVKDYLFKEGLMGIEIEKEYGGTGASFLSSCLVIEAISSIDPSVAGLIDVQNTVVNNMIRWYGSEEQKRKYLPRLARDTIGSFCLSEVNAGSDAFSLQTSATLDEDGQHFVINGSKMWISNSSDAGIFLVMANVNRAKLKHKGITCFVVEKGTPGLEIGKSERKLGLRSSSTCTIHFTDVRIPKSNVLGQIGEGYKYAISLLNEGRVGIGAQQVGLAAGVLDRTMNHLLRNKGANAFHEQQSIQFEIAQVFTELEAARNLVFNAARCKELESGVGVPRPASSTSFIKRAAYAKLFASQVAEKAASGAVNWCGKEGVDKEAIGVEKFYRDCKAGSIYEGTSNIQLSTIAKLLLSEYP